MTDLNKPEPAPRPTATQPAWELVIQFCEAQWPMDEAIAKSIVEDMRKRDQEGRKKYGVPLQAGNGRNHLIDAYQEALDKTAYLMAWLDEHRALALTDSGLFTIVQSMFMTELSMLPAIRECIEDEKADGAATT